MHDPPTRHPITIAGELARRLDPLSKEAAGTIRRLYDQSHSGGAPELLLSFTAALADFERRLVRIERDCPPLDSMAYTDSVEGA